MRSITFNYLIRLKISHGGVVTESVRNEDKTAVVAVTSYRSISRNFVLFNQGPDINFAI